MIFCVFQDMITQGIFFTSEPNSSLQNSKYCHEKLPCEKLVRCCENERNHGNDLDCLMLSTCHMIEKCCPKPMKEQSITFKIDFSSFNRKI